MYNIEQIGTIHSPFLTIEDMPIQPKGAVGIKGYVLVDEEFMTGLKDLEGFSHIYLFYSFHKTTKTELLVTPFMDINKRGVFATRSPLRPNHIGMSIVKLNEIKENKLFVENVDILDGTPLLDIKPYIKKFDEIKDSTSGWLTANAKEIEEKRSDNRFV